MCTFLMDIFVSLYEDWDHLWHSRTMTTETKDRILASIVGQHGISTQACKCRQPEEMTGLWLAGGGLCPTALPPGGSIILPKDIEQATIDAHTDDLVTMLIEKLEQAREELRYNGVFIDEPLVRVLPDEHTCQALVSARDRHLGFALGHLCGSDAIINDRRYNSASFAIDLFGIRPDTLEDIAHEVGALLSEPAVLLLDRSREKSVVLSTQ